MNLEEIEAQVKERRKQLAAVGDLIPPPPPQPAPAPAEAAAEALKKWRESWSAVAKSVQAENQAREEQIHKKQPEYFDPLPLPRRQRQAQPQQLLLPISFSFNVPTPDCILRCSLFGITKPGRRPVFTPDQPQNIETVAGYEITRVGQQTDQNDLIVWQAIMYLCSQQKIDFSLTEENQNNFVQLKTTAYELLKIMGKPDNGKERRLLYERLTRLVSTTIGIKFVYNNQRIEYVGNMLYEAIQIGKDDDKTWERHLVININKRIATLFQKNIYTLVDLQVIRELGKNQLAKWAYQLLLTHDKPYPYKIETMQRLSGKNWTSKKYFTRDLKEALEAISNALKTVKGWREGEPEPFVYAIRDDKVWPSWGKGSDPRQVPGYVPKAQRKRFSADR